MLIVVENSGKDVHNFGVSTTINNPKKVINIVND